MIILWLFCWLTTMYCVYQGGKTLNDHVVNFFVTLCMIMYVIWWILIPYEDFKNLLLVGPMSMTLCLSSWFAEKKSPILFSYVLCIFHKLDMDCLSLVGGCIYLGC